MFSNTVGIGSSSVPKASRLNAATVEFYSSDSGAGIGTLIFEIWDFLSAVLNLDLKPNYLFGAALILLEYVGVKYKFGYFSPLGDISG